MITIRATEPQDQAALLRIASEEPLFSDIEAGTVAELLRDYLAYPDHNGYLFLSAIDEGPLVGFACFGPTPLTQGTYTVYWLCIAAAARGQGTGRALMRQIEFAARAAGGRLIVLDTSGRPEYAPTRAFYERIGYTRSATILDYYAVGDDLVIYSLGLSPAAWIPQPETSLHQSHSTAVG
ncbi:MAG: GNAT family N-acetyltransferase [Anaerolineales bacterium]|nr:GNAT family N-acetyltransferase [Anaerolineales bacterium]